MANMLLFKLQYEISPDVNCDLLIYFTIKPVDKLYIEHRNKFLNHQAKWRFSITGEVKGRREEVSFVDISPDTPPQL